MEGNTKHMNDYIQKWASLINKEQCLNESKVDFKQYLFFHGSNNKNGILKKIRPPSTSDIFFVSNDLDYVKMYTKNDKGKYVGDIYAVSLNEEKLNVYDIFRDENETIMSKWSKELIDFFRDGVSDGATSISDILICFVLVIKFYYSFKTVGFDKTKYFEYFEDTFRVGDEEKAKTYIEIVYKLQKSKPDLIKYIDDHSFDDEWETAKKLRTEFCNDLKSEGYNAFQTQEIVGISRSDKCYGIFDKDAFDSFMVIPINEEKAKEALTALEYVDDEEYGFTGKNRTKSNSIIDIFIQEYKRK